MNWLTNRQSAKVLTMNFNSSDDRINSTECKMTLKFCCKNKRFQKDLITHHWANVMNHTNKAI